MRFGYGYPDHFECCVRLGSHVAERDCKAVVKMTSGLINLLHPDSPMGAVLIRGVLLNYPELPL